MLECSVCGQGEGWVEKGPEWFGDMNVDHTPPEAYQYSTEGNDIEFVMGYELTAHMEEILIPELMNLEGGAAVYTHEGQTGGFNFLYNYYLNGIGSSVIDDMVYGILVAKDGYQGSDHDPGGFLKRQLAIDTVDCDDNLFCSDYFIEDVFFVDVQPFAANERTDEDWPWPEYCEPLVTDGYASGEYSCWIIGIPIEYYATYKKIKVRMKDDVNNWRRILVYDYTDVDTELWIHPPEDDEDFPPCEIVTFEANISPDSLMGVLPYVGWLPTYANGSERLPYDEETNPTGYESEIRTPGPPWIGSEFEVIIKDAEFWAKAEIMWCDELEDDIKRVTDSIEIHFLHPSERQLEEGVYYRKYKWNEDFTEGLGWGDETKVFKQYVNYEYDAQNPVHFEGSIVDIEYAIAPFEPGTVINYSLLDPPTDIEGNILPTNPNVWDVGNPPTGINDNGLVDDGRLAIDYLPLSTTCSYEIPDPPRIPKLHLHLSNFGGYNYQVLIEVVVYDNGVPCETYSEPSPVINVWRKGEIWVYSMDNWDDEEPGYFNPDYPYADFRPDASEVNGASDDAFIVFIFKPQSEPTTYYNPIKSEETYPGWPDPTLNGILYYCDKQESIEREGHKYSTDFHDPWNAPETRDYAIQLLGADKHEDTLTAGKTTVVSDHPRRHKHSLVFIGRIYDKTAYCLRPDPSFINAMKYTAVHEIGHSLLLEDDPVTPNSVMSEFYICGFNNKHYFSAEHIELLRNNPDFP